MKAVEPDPPQLQTSIAGIVSLNPQKGLYYFISGSIFGKKLTPTAQVITHTGDPRLLVYVSTLAPACDLSCLLPN